MFRQIADALETAHDAGVIHRDLKPANVKVRADGTVKVLDFGLAKAFDQTDDGAAGGAPTMTAPAPLRDGAGSTQAGVILGTAAYMSPEQARGRPVDKRADIWAFGVMLHEALTGRRAFQGETVSDTIAAVLTSRLDPHAVPAETPANVRAQLVRCLESDPKRRLRDIGEARIALEEPGAPVPAAPHVDRPYRRMLAAGALTAAALAVGTVGGWLAAHAGWLRRQRDRAQGQRRRAERPGRHPRLRRVS